VTLLALRPFLWCVSGTLDVAFFLNAGYANKGTSARTPSEPNLHPRNLLKRDFVMSGRSQRMKVTTDLVSAGISNTVELNSESRVGTRLPPSWQLDCTDQAQRRK
jgi:hypothetical protein